MSSFIRRGKQGVVFHLDVYQVDCYKTIYLIAFLGYNHFS